MAGLQARARRKRGRNGPVKNEKIPAVGRWNGRGARGRGQPKAGREFNSLEVVYQNTKRGIFSSACARAFSLSFSFSLFVARQRPRQRACPGIFEIRHRRPCCERETTQSHLGRFYKLIRNERTAECRGV